MDQIYESIVSLSKDCKNWSPLLISLKDNSNILNTAAEYVTRNGTSTALLDLIGGLDESSYCFVVLQLLLVQYNNKKFSPQFASTFLSHALNCIRKAAQYHALYQFNISKYRIRWFIYVSVYN